MSRLISYMSPGFPESLFTRIGRVLGTSVDFESDLSGPSPDRNPFDRSQTDPALRADFGWICSTSYVALNSEAAVTGPTDLRSPTAGVQLVGVAWVPDDPGAQGRPVYFGDLVTRPGAGISSLAELQGRRVGCNDPVSLSGHYALRFALDDAGLASDHAELLFTGGHHRSLDLVLSGELDAAVVDSVVRTARARFDPAVAELAIVKRLGPWPVQPLVAHSCMSAAEISAAQRLLLEASDTPEMQAELEAAALSRFVAIGSDHYASVRQAMERLSRSSVDRIDPFRR